jgi:hypothetical protein
MGKFKRCNAGHVTLKISELILPHELLFPPPPNFQQGNLYKLVSSTNLVTYHGQLHLASVALRTADLKRSKVDSGNLK